MRIHFAYILFHPPHTILDPPFPLETLPTILVQIPITLITPLTPTPVDPKKRYTVEQCLEHPYLDAYHDPDDEPTAKPLPVDFFDFDEKKEETQVLKQLLYDEIVTFHPQ